MVKSCCQLSFLSLQALRVGNADVTSCLQCVSSKEEPMPACEQVSTRSFLFKGADFYHSACQSKEELVGFGSSEHPIFMKLLPDHLPH